MKNKFVILGIVFILFLSVNVLGHDGEDHSVIPEGLLKAQESNLEQANNYLHTITFIVAFLAGILTILSPCILPLFPAFFAYTFKDRINITKATLAFFLGFTFSFMGLGLLAVAIFKTSLVVLQIKMSILVRIFGLFLIGLGIMAALNKGFSGIVFKTKFKNDIFGTFLSGMFFAIGWTACVGPILAGILLMGSMLNNYLQILGLIFMYSFGIFVPLFILSFFYDKYQLHKKSWVKGKEIEILLFNQTIKTYTAKVISGVLFILLGIVFLIGGNTSAFNGFNFLGIRDYFYILQDKISVVIPIYLQIISFLIIILFIYLIWRFIRKNEKL